jgi:hypothetical protein
LLSLLAGILALSLAAPAWADCALLPIRAEEYRSFSSSGRLSAVNPPIAAPGEAVTVRAGVECGPQPGFDPIAANNRVHLVFKPRLGVQTDVAIDASVVTVKNCGAGVQGGGLRCDTLSFPVPDTDAQVGLAGDDLSLTGPAEVMITDPSGNPLAFVGALFLPTNACDAGEQQPETVFGHFTVLPEPTAFSGVSTSARATLDGNGNLLIPFDWTPALDKVSGAVARLVEGRASLRDGNGQLIVVPNSGFDWFRSFVDGRSVPPFINQFTDANNVTSVLGTIDYPDSVLRLSQRGLDANGATIQLYDADVLALEQVEGKGPIVINEGLTLRELTVVPLNSLNVGPDLTAIAADEEIEAQSDPFPPFPPTAGDRNGDADALDKVVQIIQSATNLFTNTQLAVLETPTTPPRAILAAGRHFAGFCMSEAAQGNQDVNGDSDALDGIFTAVAPDGTRLTGATRESCDRRPFVGDKPLAVSNQFAFFRTFEPDDTSSDPEATWERGTLTGRMHRTRHTKSIVDMSFRFHPGEEEIPGIDYGGATTQEHPGQFHGVATHSSTAGVDGVLKGTWIAPGPGLDPLFLALMTKGAFHFDAPEIAVGSTASVVGDLGHIIAHPPLPDLEGLGYRLTLVVTEVDLENDNDNDGHDDDDDDEGYRHGHGHGYDHGHLESFDFSGTLEFFSMRPPQPGVNGDGDALDTVLRVFDASTGQFVPQAEVAAASGAVAGGRIAFLTPETDEGGFDGNGDGDFDDHIAQLFDGPQHTLRNLGLAAGDIALSNTDVCVCVSESDQGAGGSDFNADGDKTDGALFYAPIGSANPPIDAGIACDQVAAVDGACVFTVPEADQGAGGTTLNDDGDTLDDVLHVLRTATGAIENTGQAAKDFVVGPPYTVGGQVAFHLVAMRTCEAAQNDGGFEGNRDDDTTDCVAQLYKIPGPADDGSVPALINTRIAAQICDLPGCDPFFEPYRMNGPVLSVLGPELDGFGNAQKSDICLATSPDGVCDYTGNDDGGEDVIHIFNALSGQRQVFAVSRDSQQDVSPFLHDTLGDTHMLYCAPEAFFGVDIDGDGEIGTGDVCVLIDDADDDFTLDADGSGNVSDSCLEEPNSMQLDLDGDGLGDQVCDSNSETAAPLACDVDFDGDIDRVDVDRILADRRAQAAGPVDPRDPDRDGRISIADADICDSRIPPPAPAPPPPGGCGLLGIEALLPLAALAARRARRRRPARLESEA